MADHPRALLARLALPRARMRAAGDGATASISGARDLAALRRILREYRDRALYALELPVIAQAHHHAAVGGVRELVVLDRELAAGFAQTASAAAQPHVDPSRWRDLRPLRDDRVLRRFAAAVEQQEATGCLSVVYGILLVVYSVPLRQGLHDYATARIEELAGSSAWGPGMPDREVGLLATGLLRGLPRVVNSLCEGAPRSMPAAPGAATRAQPARSGIGVKAGVRSAPGVAPVVAEPGATGSRGSGTARGAGTP